MSNPTTSHDTLEPLSEMALFARLVDAGSLTAAARQLGRSKSAVSKQLARLEDRLGARLLNRTTRRQALTEVGRVFYEHCARLLVEAEAAAASVANLQAAPRGLLKVNSPMSFGVLHLAPAIPEFLARYPEMQIEMALNDRVVDLLDEGYDVGVRIGRLPDSSLVARRLAPSRRVVCGAPAYFARHGRPLRPADLKQHACLRYTNLPLGEEWRFSGPPLVETVRIAGPFAANNGEALREAALAGLGLIMAPTFIVGPDLLAGRLETVLTDYGDDAGAVFAVYPHKRHLSAKVRAFIDFLAERFGPEPYWDCPLVKARTLPLQALPVQATPDAGAEAGSQAGRIMVKTVSTNV